jgi:hypothetical protein
MSKNRGRLAFATSFLAVALGVGLVAAAFWLPVYNDGGTLVAVNGTGVLLPVSLPLALAVIAFVGLWARCTRGSVLGDRFAVAVLSILGVFTLLGAMTIGIFVLPLTLLVATSVALTPKGSRL